MELRVWVDAWQMQCCGTPFAVGDEVSWTVEDADADWLVSVLGPETAATVQGAEEHHGGLPEGTSATIGTVTDISAVHCRYQSAVDGDGLHRPVPGSALLTRVRSADGWDRERGEHSFVGYLVGLAVAEEGRR